MRNSGRLRIAVVGSGIAGMAAAWLLHRDHDVTVYEAEPQPGGHSRTVEIPGADGPVPVDMGFIVYNPPAYPNFTALLAHMGVSTHGSDMSFAVSLRGGSLEYAGTDLAGMFGQRRNFVSPRFWTMLRDIARFYREAEADAAGLDPDISLAAYLAARGYGDAFMRDHLLPMAAAIWSAPAARIADYPAATFIRFCANHGLLLLRDRPQWRTVSGGSREYVRRLTAPFADAIRLSCAVREIRRFPDGVVLRAADGIAARYDHVIIATHACQARALLSDPSAAEHALLGAIRSTENEVVMHRDPSLMPRRRRVWASWNYIGAASGDALCVTYWMNRLQHIPGAGPVFVTLNPARPPAPASVLHRERFAHPLFDATALRAQRELWDLQGQRRTWFCGAWLGAGFHEDGLQAGLAVAEALGGVRRPWRVAGGSNWLPPDATVARSDAREAAATAAGGVSGSALYTGTVVHTRLRPVRHRLRYRMLTVLLDLDELSALTRRLRLFSIDRFNLFGFAASDHLAGDGQTLRTQVETAMAAAGLAPDGGRILLLTMPRVLGAVFNPLSVFFCHDRSGALRAVLYEVNNTFGQRHSYLIPVDGPAERTIRQECPKDFYVSPFMDMALRYRFRLTQPGETLSLAIQVSDERGTILTAGLSVRRQPMTDAALARGFLRHPLLAAQVLGGIHWEAVKLWRKGMRVQPRPPPPPTPISIVTSGRVA